MYLKISIFTFVLFSAVFSAVDTSDYAQGVAALNRGDLKNAKIRLAAAYKKNSSDPVIQMSYASVASCSLAVSIYKSVSENSQASDSIRTSALRKLGDYYYISKEYQRSLENYRSAARLGKDPICKHYWALASLASGDTASSKSIWHTLTLEFGDTISEIANYHLGLLLYKQGQYHDAHSCFSKCGTPSQNKPWAVSAIQCKIDCLKKLGKTETVPELEKQLDPWRDIVPSKSFALKSASLPQSNSESSSSAEVDNIKDDSAVLFTLQVGAFGQKENAKALEQKLRGLFSDVKTVEFDFEDKKFFRVWVGTFNTKDAATLFGNDSIVKKGFTFRVVEKE